MSNPRPFVAIRMKALKKGHFVTSQRVYSAISEAGVINSGENPSNHSAIFTKLNVEELDLTLEAHAPPVRVQWGKANSDAQSKYKTCLSEKLNSISLPECINCQNLQCKEHSEMLEVYTMDVMEAIETVAKETLPLSGGTAKKGHSGDIVAGWSEHIKPYAEDSKFWFSIWESLGKPLQGDVFNRMRLSKNQYKYAIRRLKRVNDNLHVFGKCDEWWLQYFSRN